MRQQLFTAFLESLAFATSLAKFLSIVFLNYEVTSDFWIRMHLVIVTVYVESCSTEILVKVANKMFNK